jgi:tRNA(Ile)-lysidine synthase
MELGIRNEIEKHHLLEVGDRVLIGVSGGPDSMALLHWLMTHRHTWNLTIRAVHLNHQFRGQEADLDQAYVEEMCQKWEIPYSSEKINVKQYAKEHKLNKQVAARECRYALFQELASKYEFQKVALAHHGDDQVETVLMRLIRGAGLSGLSGIPTKRIADGYTIIRPLMSISKSRIEEYCQFHGIVPRIDQSNESDDYTRNKIRHHLVPSLIELNPNLRQVIADMTQLLREEDHYLDEVAQQYVKKVIELESPHTISINLLLFGEIPLPLQRRVVLLILNCLTKIPLDWGKVHIEQILELTRKGNGSKQIHLPHQIVARREYEHLSFFNHAEKGNQEDRSTVLYQHLLPSEGEYHFTNPPIHIKIVRHSNTSSPFQNDPQKWNAGRKQLVATFDSEELTFPLVLRCRIPGDRIQPIGMEGHKKVKDIFIDQKIPSSQRDHWPILADQSGILWITGLKRGSRGKVTDETEDVITIVVVLQD